MPKIHETAIVSANAQIAEDVEIGPFSVIEDNVTIDAGTTIGSHVVVKNYTHIGKNNHLYQFSSIGEAPQYHGYDGEPTLLEIGDNNIIREFCTLNRGTAHDAGVTRIGSDNFIMAYVHIAHDCVIGNNTIFANGSSLAGHVEVGDYAILGGFSLVHQFCKVGAHCITGIGAICFQDIPPFMIAAGNSARPYGINLKGLKRRGFSEQSVSALKSAYRLLYRSNLDLKTAIEEISQLDGQINELSQLCDFLRDSKRGIIR